MNSELYYYYYYYYTHLTYVELSLHSICLTSRAMSGKGQAYCPKCKKLNPGHEYGRCRLVQCTICKEFGHSSFQCGKGSCWICGSKDHFKSACPEYYSEEFKRQKLVEGKKIEGKGKAPMKRASTEKVSGPSPSKVSSLPSLLELPTPPPTTKSYAQTVTGAKASPASTPTPPTRPD